MLQYVEAGERAENLHINVSQAIHFIIKAWNEVNAKIISNCWHHTKFLSDANVDFRDISEDIRQNETLVLRDLADLLRALNLSYLM